MTQIEALKWILMDLVDNCKNLPIPKIQTIVDGEGYVLDWRVAFMKIENDGVGYSYFTHGAFEPGLHEIYLNSEEIPTEKYKFIMARDAPDLYEYLKEQNEILRRVYRGRVGTVVSRDQGHLDL